MKKWLVRIAGLLLAFALVASQGVLPKLNTAQKAPYYWPTNGWRASTPELQGMDSGKLGKLLDAIQSNSVRLHSILIIRNGYLVLEAYYPPYGPDIRHSIESNTKSIIGTLTGIAIDQGKIQNVNQKLVDFFPDQVIDHLDARKQSMTLRNLLSMTPGLDCQDQSTSANDMYAAQGWVQYLLNLPMLSKPGEKWVYCSGASHLLSAVLQQKTGMDARTYANQVLFTPLGIAPVEEKDWAADPQGVTNGIAGLYLTPRELAKYGFLYLQHGQWDGKQIVSEKWVEASTSEQAYIGQDPYVNGLDRRFGYMFSVFPEQKYYGYLGMAGQELLVIPEKNMVVVFTASLEFGKEAKLLKLLNDYILPAVNSDQALPENNQAAAHLQASLEKTKQTKKPVASFPQVALDVSGKTYSLEQNSMGWQSMMFVFQPGTDEAVIKMDGSPQNLKIGLDNIYRLNKGSRSRPTGLRGTWKSANVFSLEYIILGDFMEVVANIQFNRDQIRVTLVNLNFGSQSMVLRGTMQK